MAKVPENFLMQRRMNGLDAYQPAADLAPGDVSGLQNMYSYDGEWYSRWGKVACFVTPPSSNPSYGTVEFIRSDGSAVLVFVNNGKLYYAVAGTPPLTSVEIKINGSTSFSLNSSGVQMKKAGKYLYIVDGVGSLYRINPDALFTTGMVGAGQAAVVTALTAPNAPSVSLTNTTIDAMSSATNWSSFPTLSWLGSTAVSTANAETIYNTADQQFTGGTGSPSPHPTGWLQGGDSMGFQSSATGYGNECYFDVGNGPEWVDWDYPTPTYPTTGGPAGGAKCTIASARVWVGGANGHSSGGGGFQMVAFPEDASVQSVTLQQGSDLQILSTGSNTATVGSAGYTFVSTGGPSGTGDIGKILTIFKGTDVTAAGNYTITSISSGHAVINGVPGSAGGHTDGVWSMGLDSGGAAANSNNTLAQPPSALTGYKAGVQSPLFKCSASNSKFSNVFSFSNVGQDFDYVKFRLFGPAQNVGTGVNSPSWKVADVRLAVAGTSTGKLHVTANNVDGGYCLGGCWLQKDYTGGTSTAYTDLVVDNTTNTIVTSAGHPFQTSQVGQVLVVTGGTGWTTGNYVIQSVDSSHKATLSASPAATGTTGGAGSAYTVQDYSKNNVISIGYSAPSTTPGPTSATPIQFRVGILKAGQTIGNIIWSNLCSFAADGMSFYVDISTIDNSDSNARAQCAYFYIRIENDLPSSVNLSDLFTLGPITGAGNLSINLAAYNWVGVAAQDTSLTTGGASSGNTTDGIILSNPSFASAPSLSPTTYQAKALVTFDSSYYTASNNSSCNWLYVYRFGGALASPNVTQYTSYTLVDQCPRWSGTTNGQTATSTGAVGGGSWTWSTSTNLWTS
ncbi:MAG: hypothetical protein KGL39_48840, partial [Patescibacteria group bacterium]|nr:hypothetical protein [Patescibacteria group bacterium]